MVCPFAVKNAQNPKFYEHTFEYCIDKGLKYNLIKSGTCKTAFFLKKLEAKKSKF